jgi:predicted unusual protein kinase regulating ubiquinone biosynthesis (AarF/ABC1/UbiB family)
MSGKLKPSAVPSGRWSRMAKLGSLAGGVAGNMLAEGARQFAQGKRPKINDLLLTPANARRVTEQLAQLRGAAMKVGQLMSMDAGEFLPPELAEILARLRANASPMPMSQVVSVLNANWGEGWDRHFQQFSFYAGGGGVDWSGPSGADQGRPAPGDKNPVPRRAPKHQQ